MAGQAEREETVTTLRSALERIAPPDPGAAARAQARQDRLTKPQGSLGRLEELSVSIAGMTGAERPRLARKVIFTLAGDHGVTAEGVSAYPAEVTAQMVYNFLRNGAGINVLAGLTGARVIVADMGVAQTLRVDTAAHPNFRDCRIAPGTANIARGPAMSRPDAIRAIEAGIALIEQEIPSGIHLAGTGEMGIGNTTPSSAITACITGLPVRDVTGLGTGIDDAGFARKVAAIERALAVNRPDAADGIDVLAKVGGFEIGGLAGVIIGAASRRIPVVIDGFISGAAALIAYTIDRRTRDYMIASHCSVERGHRAALTHLGLAPLLDLGLRLGEGTGAALAFGIIDGAVRILDEMATFDEAQVSGKGRL